MQLYLLVTIFLSPALHFGFAYPQDKSQDYKTVRADESEDDEMYLEGESRQEVDERESKQQTFYPSFAPFQNPPLGHSRPFYYQQEAAYSQRPQSGYQQQQVAYDSPRYSGFKDDDEYRASANSESQGLLGSGNFGVIRGGTFYDNNEAEATNYDRDYSSLFFRNGHGRPSFAYGGSQNPRPRQQQQFENFRDFADINTPSNPAYSQYVVVYANKNSTKLNNAQILEHKPKNIIESLALLDLESATPDDTAIVKKISKNKEKLAKVLPEKKVKMKNQVKVSRELHEPLLALS